MEDREERAERKYTEEVLDEEKEDGQLLEGETVKGERGSWYADEDDDEGGEVRKVENKQD